MKKKTGTIVLVLVVAGLTALTGCKKEPEIVLLPVVTATTVTQITVSSAIVRGSVVVQGSSDITARGFCWSTSPDPEISDNKLTEGKGLGQFTSRITGLLPGTDYHVRGWATNLEGTSYGSAEVIRTPLTVTQATLGTLAPSHITFTSAVSGGEITDIGGGEIIERGICWSTDPSPTVENFKTTVSISGAATGNFTIKISSLEPGKKYYLRSYAINSAGVAYGPEFSFRTLMQLGTRSSDFPGNGSPTVTFAIGSKVYVGLCSLDWGQTETDLWEWDQVTGQWTRLADYPGSIDGTPAGFSVAGKGYVLKSRWFAENEDTTEFWEYDPGHNKWTQKSNLPASGFRLSPVAFSIGSRGYVGLGIVGITADYAADYKNDFWEYDPATDVWIRKADFPGQSRSGAAAFSIGNKGFVGSGVTEEEMVIDFWEYDQYSNKWTRKKDFPGASRTGAIGFSIGSKGYIGAGFYSGSPDETRQDFWEWDQTLNTWTRIGYVAEALFAEAGGYAGAGGYFLSSHLTVSQPAALWTFYLTSDK